MTARKDALTKMNTGASPQNIFGTFLRQVQSWLEQSPGLFNPINSSLALLSVAHLAMAAQVLGHSTRTNFAVPALGTVLLQKTMAQIDVAAHHSLSNILWACARLNVRPDDLLPNCEVALTDRLIATEAEASLQGASSTLWACGCLGLNSEDGRLVESSLSAVKRCIITDPISADQMHSLSMTMWALATMRLHTDPELAERIVTRLYQGVIQGLAAPQAIVNVLWACASLGYSPSRHMLQQFKTSYSDAENTFSLQHDSTLVWSLAVLGALDMPFFQTVILRLASKQTAVPGIVQTQQLYQALQSLKPEDLGSQEHQEWAEVTFDPAALNNHLSESVQLHDIVSVSMLQNIASTATFSSYRLFTAVLT